MLALIGSVRQKSRILDFRPGGVESGRKCSSSIVFEGRQIAVPGVSPRRNASKSTPFPVELPGSAGFSTAFSTVVEILGEKPKVARWLVRPAQDWRL